MDFEQVAKNEYELRGGNPLYKNMAKGKLKECYRLREEINKILCHNKGCLKHLVIKNNIAAPSNSATLDIIEENTFYCLNRKQEIITDGLHQIQSIYADLQK